MSAAISPSLPSAPANGTLSAEDVLSFFHGKMPRQRQSPLYGVGLSIVAIGMVLLPLIYLALIAATAWGVVWHLQNNTGMIVGQGRATAVTFLLYVTPALIGGILLLFMVKPLFARRSQHSVPFPLLESDQPALFAFIRRICKLTGAPEPKVVEVDCQVNASASFRHGFWSIFLPGDLKLTIGLPLVAGMTLPQLGGVLAHEFGHFAQGMGMRLTYVIRSVNAWFSRVVYERDSWDDRLLEWASNDDWRVKIVFQASRGAVWVTRRILWLLMMTGHGISSFMMRQMEFDADTYEARFAGSGTFAATSRRLRELSVGGQAAMHGLRESFRSRRMPDDFPAFLVGRVADVPQDVMEKVHGGVAEEKTGWFDSHPCDRDRIAAAARLAQQGIFHADAPASAVFSGFDGLCLAATAHHYAQVLELPMNELNLVKTEATAAEAHKQSESRRELSAALGAGGMDYLVPIAARKTVPWHMADAADFETARAEIQAQQDDAAKAMAAFTELDDKADALDVAEALLSANFTFSPEAFGINSLTTAAVKVARQAITTGKQPHAGTLRRFHDSVDTALATGLALHAEAARPRVEALLHVLDVLAWASPSVYRAWSYARAMQMLAENMSHHPDPAGVQRHMEQVAHQIEVLLAPLRESLLSTEYPYDHAQGNVTLWASVFPTPAKADNIMSKAFEDARRFIDHLPSLHLRVLGELCSLACLRETREQGRPGPVLLG